MSSKTRAQLASEISSDFADNTSGAITPVLLRGVVQDMVDSSPNLTDGPYTIYSGDGTLAGNRTVDCGSHGLTFQNFSFVEIISDPSFSSNYTEINATGNSFSFESSDGTDVCTFVTSSGGNMQFKAKVLAIQGKSGGTLSVTGPSIAISGAITDLLGFYGIPPIAQPASADQAIATDPASTMALANALRLALVNLGLIKGAA